MESSKINQKTLLSFFTKQHLNGDPDASSSRSGTNSIPLPATSDDKSGLPATAIKSISGKISILIDVSTTLSDKSTLIVYLKCETSKDLPPNVLFLDLIELPNQTADSIFEALLGCLKKYGFDREYLKENLVAFACDSASVMLGKKSGVVEKLLQEFPNIVPWHCMNHRIELAVSDSISDVGAINHFQIFMDKPYTLYSKSPKNQRELAECVSERDLELNKIERILGTRWISSSLKTAECVSERDLELNKIERILGTRWISSKTPLKQLRPFGIAIKLCTLSLRRLKKTSRTELQLKGRCTED
ncbi:hypothetical protein QE152_g39790 [Popillia japonica]|uniref:E3 SUMO-protein ligase KIAA1586-like n=1 Tax=Popillia japonica TaxID=7064 RepID=A0AAW1HT70_POPJA